MSRIPKTRNSQGGGRDNNVSMLKCDVIVIGGGAAGLFCAIQAGKRGRKVLVLEHSETIGKKIRISGGGRCNFTNIYTNADNFTSSNPHFCKSALARYTPADFISLVKKHGIAYHEKKLGQLFCDGSSQQIIDLLLREGEAAGVEVRRGCQVHNVNKDPQAGSFSVRTSQGTIRSSSLVIATGGLSIAMLGATDFGYRIARQFGLRVEEPRPGLVPLTLTSQMLKQLAKLSGVSLEAVVSCVGRDSRRAPEFRENILITHRGLSGPAILQISTYWKQGTPISINLLPDEDVYEMLKSNQGSGIELANLLSRYLPKRFAQAWCELYAASKPLKQYNDSELRDIAQKFHIMQVTPAGTEGFRKAEVTAGGVATAELSNHGSQTRSGTLFYRRSCGCDRTTGGLQFSVGLGFGLCGRAVCVDVEVCRLISFSLLTLEEGPETGALLRWDTQAHSLKALFALVALRRGQRLGFNKDVFDLGVPISNLLFQFIDCCGNFRCSELCLKLYIQGEQHVIRTEVHSKRFPDFHDRRVRARNRADAAESFLIHSFADEQALAFVCEKPGHDAENHADGY